MSRAVPQIPSLCLRGMLRGDLYLYLSKITENDGVVGTGAKM